VKISLIICLEGGSIKDVKDERKTKKRKEKGGGGNSKEGGHETV